MQRSGMTLILVVVVFGCSNTPPPPVPTPEGPAPRVDRDEPAPKKEPKARPERKNIVTLTPAAAAQVRALQEKQGYKYLRVSVKESAPGAGDFERKLDLDNEMDLKEDYLGESQGVQIVVDRESSLLLPEGTTVDYVQVGERVRFTFSSSRPDVPLDKTKTLAEARKGFKTKLTRQVSAKTQVAEPPPDVLRVVRYDAPAGKLAAYLTPDPKDGTKHPAIIWITGGDCNTIDQGCWREGQPSNDQSASAYRKAGIVMMFPSLRGGNDNPGFKEAFLGEVNDVLAAADYLAKQEFVDPARIYLGGHSTGGTLALLTAEYSDRFRAVFSFGPADDILGYGLQDLPFAVSDPMELQLRAPGRWLHSIRVPVFVFEGTAQGNLRSLQAMARASDNPKAHFLPVKGANHFSLLGPTNALIAGKILRDDGPACNLSFTEEEVSKPFAK